MTRSAWCRLLASLVIGLLGGCRPDLGECDEARARTVVYTDDIYGWPAYEGQALVESSCGGRSGECHSSIAEGASRHGAPAGLDFDLTVLNAATATASTDALAHGQLQTYKYRYDIVRQVEAGSMPPGSAGAAFVSGNTYYYGLPSIDSAEGRSILRNWLACGAPVVERTEPLAVPTTVGAVVSVRPCPDPMTDACGGASCIDLSTDAANCGACGNVCVADPRTCTSGECDCPSGWQRDSSNNCRDLTSDPANCGSFGNACPPGVGCVGGACTCSDPAQTLCTDGCTDTAIDPQNCSGCGLACPPGAFCSGSTCMCGTGLSACIAGCVDTQSDVANCGTCEHTCNPGEVCFGGQCLAGGCPGTTTDCSGSCVDLSSNGSNCGSCGNACLVAGTSCIGGACACPMQSPTLSLCSSGCVDLTSNSANCGACGAACPAGTVCSGSQCVCANAGYTACGNGCFDLQNDSQNCGACGALCPSGASCSGGSCACQTAGLSACGSACVDLTSDAANCGSCGHVCPNGQACNNGSCFAVSFSNDIQPIFSAQCALSGCHTGRRPAASLALDAAGAYAGLVGSGSGAASSECTSPSRMRVAPGAPDSSYLVDKLLGINLCQGNQMPKIGTYLPSQQIDMIRAWIQAGAANN